MIILLPCVVSASVWRCVGRVKGAPSKCSWVTVSSTVCRRSLVSWRVAEQLSHLRLLGDGHGREVAAVTFVAGGHNYVPHRGIDRRPADQADAVQVLVEGRHHFQVNRDD